MNEYSKYWVWLQHCLGYGAAKVRTVMKFYPSVKDFYDAGEHEWVLCGCFTRGELNNLSNFTIGQAQEIIDRCISLDYTVLTIDEKGYPKNLLEIYNPPAVLYIKGNLPDVDNILSIAMVGTRNATAGGRKAAFTIAAQLSKAGVIVVSGGALGIDCASHKGVLQADGTTICVLGCGINYNYLMTNAQMRSQIAINGAVVSEYPPDTPPSKHSFPMRNRIISGLCKGTLVVEAGEKSGALITARFAAEQNRDVFAVPGDITNATCFGTNSLIRQGVKPILSYKDILEEYENTYYCDIKDDSFEKMDIPDIPCSYIKNKNSNGNIKSSNTYNLNKNAEVKNKEKRNLSEFSGNAQIIYNVIYENPSSIDDIILKTGLPVSKVMQSLTELELSEAVERKSGRMYFSV